jgi:hypothetical protein
MTEDAAVQPLLASRSSVGLRIELPFFGHVYGKRPAAAVQLIDAAQVAVLSRRWRGSGCLAICKLGYRDADNSDAFGMRPSGVYLSTASGRSLESLDRISSRDRPVC